MPTAIVTRATVGIGPPLTLSLAELGWRLVLGGEEPRHLEAQAARLATTTEVAALPGDVRRPDHREQLVAAAGARLDLLVNNEAPPAHDAQEIVDDHPLDLLEDLYRDTVLAPLALVELALPRLAAGARIVNVIPAAHGSADPRSASSLALEQLTGVLTAAHPKLRIDAVHPARVKSHAEMLEQIVGVAQESRQRGLDGVCVS